MNKKINKKNHEMKLQILLFAILNFIFFCDYAEAQSSLQTPVNLGMGGGGTAYIDSYQANFVNPANLMLNGAERPSVSVGILGTFGVSSGGSLVNIDVYNRYLTQGLTIRDDVANDMLDEWFGRDLDRFRSVDLDIGYIPAGTAVRTNSWAVSAALRNRVLADIEMNRGSAELIMLGLNSSTFGEGKPVNLNFETVAFSELSFGFATILAGRQESSARSNRVLYAGIAPKILFGHHASGFNLDSRLTVQEAADQQSAGIMHDFTYTMEASGQLADQLNEYYMERRVGGNPVKSGDFIDLQPADFYGIQSIGFGLDIGATLEMKLDESFLDLPLLRGEKTLRAGLSLTDIGVIQFGSRSGVFSANGLVDWQGSNFDQDLIDSEFNGSSEDYFESVLVDSIGSDIYGNFSPQQGASVSRNLPASVNLGMHLAVGRLGLAFDTGKGFNDRGINSRRMYAAFGAEYKFFGFWPIRTGIRTGGYSSNSIHVGTGLEFKNFEFTVAASTVPRSRRYGSGAGAAWSGFIFHF